MFIFYETRNVEFVVVLRNVILDEWSIFVRKTKLFIYVEFQVNSLLLRNTCLRLWDVIRRNSYLLL